MPRIKWHSERVKPKQGEMVLAVCKVAGETTPIMTVGAFWKFTGWLLEGVAVATVRYWTPLSPLYDILTEQIEVEGC